MEIKKGEAHIWSIQPEDCSGLTAEYLNILPEHEKKRAAEFRFENDRYKYIVTHAVLRILLGRYLKTEPARLTFLYNKQGKPYLDLTSGETDIFFNLSHSHDMAVIAISGGYEVGVDIEYMLRLANIMDIAKRFFSKGENRKLDSLPEYLQKEAFFRCWTRKEAYLKGKGLGISASLKSFEVSLLPDEPPAVLASDKFPEDVKKWRLFNINTAAGYTGALAVQGELRKIEYFRFFC